MIKFFRNIRQNLLKEGKTQKYLKYAIGGIVLVVIGILIALQINNWNEGKKLHVKEVEHLENIRKNLQTNITLLEKYMVFHRTSINSYKSLSEVIKNKVGYNDSLGYDLHMALIFPESKLSYAGYESLKSFGFDIIKDKNIRNSIIDVFELTYPEMRENLSVTENEVSLVTTPFRMEHFEMIDVGEGLIPNDFETLRENQTLKNHLSVYNNVNNWAIFLKDKCIQESKKLIVLIDNELGKK